MDDNGCRKVSCRTTRRRLHSKQHRISPAQLCGLRGRSKANAHPRRPSTQTRPPKQYSAPIDRVRRKRQRLPSSPHIENVPAPATWLCPRIFPPGHFRSRLATSRSRRMRPGGSGASHSAVWKPMAATVRPELLAVAVKATPGVVSERNFQALPRHVKAGWATIRSYDDKRALTS
jgi:hypothetical protein